MRVFGCTCYVLKLLRSSKFEAKAREGTLLEVLDYGIYRILVHGNSVESHEIVTSRHVTFDEERFLGASYLENIMDEERSNDTNSLDERTIDELSESEGEFHNISQPCDEDKQESTSSFDSCKENEDSGPENEIDNEIMSEAATATRRYPSRDRMPPPSGMLRHQ